MRSCPSLCLPLAATVAVLIAAPAVASADLSRGVMAAFKGELVVTKGDLPEGKTDKETIAKIKAERVKEVTGEPKGDVTGWHFHYTAFLSKAGASRLKIEFYAGDKLVADNRLDGVDPKLTVLSGDINIDEDEGLAKGKSYVVKIVTDKDAVVASTPLTMK